MEKTHRPAGLSAPTRVKETALPWGQVVAILTVQLVEAVQISILFPFVVFMIRDFGVAEKEEDVGRYAGFLATAFCMAQFASSFVWGHTSDSLGRKRCILLGTVGVFLATLIFGTARTFAQALVGRILAGLLNGTPLLPQCNSFLQVHSKGDLQLLEGAIKAEGVCQLVFLGVHACAPFEEGILHGGGVHKSLVISRKEIWC